MDISRKVRFLELLEPVYPRLSRYALAMTRDREEARDLVSEAVLVTLERFDTIRDEAGFPGFLFRVVSRTYKRWHYRERLRSPFDTQKISTLEDTTPHPDHAAEVAIVLEALKGLPFRMRETILLYDIADLTLETVRDIQGGSLSGVKSRIRRGHAIVQRRLGVAEPFSGKLKTSTSNQRMLTDGISDNTPIMEETEVYAL